MCELDDNLDEFYTCSACGSENVNVEIYQGYTGVVAPDGYRETATEEYMECLECGAKEAL